MPGLSEKSTAEMPFKYNHGNNSSIVFIRRKYGVRIAEVNRIFGHDPALVGL
jgi:hypothetical protein